MAEVAETVKGKNNQVKRIWLGFWILTVVTTIEVLLGNLEPQVLRVHEIFHIQWINFIFIVLTLIKAYYIIYIFMHMEHETKSLRRTIVWGVSIYIVAILFVFLVEGAGEHEVIRNSVMTWNF